MAERLALAVVLLASWAVPATSAQASGPSCARGPQRIGNEIQGTPCADVIHAPPGVTAVHGGAGDDTIVATPIAATTDCPAGCHLGVGSQTFDGGPGNDIVYGERGNDTLNGGGGDDRLYGGIGDDLLRGGPGNDFLSGGFGADSLDGESGDDFVRGDATLDKIADGGGTDTLSYGTGVTPGFNNNPEKGYPPFSDYTGFPDAGGERGVYIDLAKGIGDNGVAPDGGGLDGANEGELEGADFERVIGTPFSDYIVGTPRAETIYGGGGADVILGGGGADHIHGGADGDSCSGEEAAEITECESGGEEVAPRDPAKVTAGLMTPASSGEAELYLAGSDGDGEVTATYSPSNVVFRLEGGSVGSFDASSSTEGGCEPPTSTELVCPFSGTLDSIVLAGLGGNDSLSASGFPDSTSVILLGGPGTDSLIGGETEDVVVDGPGNDELKALDGDDALLNNGGVDSLDGGTGSDLFLSDSICDGDLLNGGAGDYRDNASWTKLKEPVAVRLDPGIAGRPGGGQPSCSGVESLDHLQTIEDLEGTSQGDFFHGDGGSNQLLGHLGPDSYFAEAGDDTILANSGDSDLVIDCGEGNDTAFIDRPTEKYADPAPSGCETVYEAEPNSFQPPEALFAPESAANPAPATSPPRDTTPPRTRILHRPGKVVFTRKRRRTVAFAFASNEPGSSFRCRLDRGPFRPCSSPRRYRVGPGRHTVRIFAVALAGNADRTPAVFRFRVRRVSARSSRSHRRRAPTR